MPIGLKLDPANLVPPFECSLPAVLREYGERALFKSHALTRETYSTESVLVNSSPRSTPALKMTPFARRSRLLCDSDSVELVRYAKEHGHELASDNEANRAISHIEVALSEVIGSYPFLLNAVSELVWCCHIVHPRSDEYDVSFSDPAIPFSIFVSAPARTDRSSVLRVAENLVHETMHLQLTLFEGLCALVNIASTWRMRSPWKRDQRPAQGLMHGLYVYSVLRWLWRQVSETTQNRIEREFALRRTADIDEEVLAIRALEESPALTEEGRHFLRQLFSA